MKKRGEVVKIIWAAALIIFVGVLLSGVGLADGLGYVSEEEEEQRKKFLTRGEPHIHE